LIEPGKVAPEQEMLCRYCTMNFADIVALPVQRLSTPKSHLYLWCPNALLPQGRDQSDVRLAPPLSIAALNRILNMILNVRFSIQAQL
jgi:hypothetical protein